MKYWFVRSPFKTRKWEGILMSGLFNLYGIRSNAAKKNISEMKKGDMALWYSSSAGKKVFGVMKVKSNAFSDNTADKDWLAIDFIPTKTFNNPVSLSSIRENCILADSSIVKQNRITVVEISKDKYEELLKLGEKN